MRLLTPERLLEELPSRHPGLRVWGCDPGPSAGSVGLLDVVGDRVVVGHWAEWWTMPDGRFMAHWMDAEAPWCPASPDAHDDLAGLVNDYVEYGNIAAIEAPEAFRRGSNNLAQLSESAGAWRLALHCHRMYRPTPNQARQWLGCSKGDQRGPAVDRRVKARVLGLLDVPTRYGRQDNPALTERGRKARHVYDALACALMGAALHVAYMEGQ